jgi:hypothetical protein
LSQLVKVPKSDQNRPVVYIAGGLLLLGAVAGGMAGEPPSRGGSSWSLAPNTTAAPVAPTPVAPTPVEPTPSTPVAQNPIPPMPVAPMPFAPMPVAPMPVARPVAPSPVWYPAPSSRSAPNLVVAGGLGRGTVGCPNRPSTGSYVAPVAFVPPNGAPPLGAADRAQTPVAAPRIQPLPFQEAHWQGLELLPNTRTLAKLLKLPHDAKGVIVDEATMPADDAGFLAGDMVTAVGGIPTPDLMSFILATSEVRSSHRIQVDILRKDQRKQLVLAGLMGRLGTANGETAQTIPPGSLPPHAYKGACTNCHRIGTQGQLPTDQGDLLVKTAPPIQAGQTPPHEVRGTCSACHSITAQTGTGAVQ